MIFIPYNRNLSIELIEGEPQSEVHVLLPEDYQEASGPHTVVRVGESGSALDCKSSWIPGQLIVVETRMITELMYAGETFYCILENYVLGEFREEGA